MQLQEAELNIISPQATQIIARDDFEQTSEVNASILPYLLLQDHSRLSWWKQGWVAKFKL